jgi:monoamine oxidase
MHKLAEKYGVHISDVSSQGKSIFFYSGSVKRYSGLLPPVAPWTLIDAGTAIRKLESLADTVDLEQRWKTPGAETLDNTTVEDGSGAIARQLGPRAFSDLLSKPFGELLLLR